MKLSVQRIRRGMKSSEGEKKRGSHPEDGCEGSEGADRGRKKKESPPGAVTERETGREGAKERGVVRKPWEGRGGGFSSVAVSRPAPLQNSGELRQKKGRRILCSRLSIITQFDCRSQSVS